jgi:hypothetical protein
MFELRRVTGKRKLCRKNIALFTTLYLFVVIFGVTVGNKSVTVGNTCVGFRQEVNAGYRIWP